jgi:predicted membrane protein
MDITDVTITPMIAVGMATVPVLVKALTGWSTGVSIAVGIIPGAAIGFLAGLLLFWAVSWMLHKAFSRKINKDSG